MALPAIKEDAKMLQSKFPFPVSSPCASISAVRSLSPRFTSSTSLELVVPQPTFEILPSQSSLNWWLHDMETVWPIRRRFYSSDIILQSSRPTLAKLSKQNARRDHEYVSNNNRCQDFSSDHDNCDEKCEPEPPLTDPIELARLAIRRRTCSEIFTKSSRAPSSLFYMANKNALGYKINGYIIDRRDEEAGEARVGQWLANLNEDCEVDDHENDEFLRSSWSSRGCLRRLSSDFASASNDSMESDGQHIEKLRNLQQLFQEGFITVTEYKDRRVQLVDELSESEQTIAKTSDLLSWVQPILYRDPPDFTLLRKRDAIKHVFDSRQCKWTSSQIQVKIDTKPFGRGGLRQVFHLQDLSESNSFGTKRHEADGDSASVKCTNYVAKIAINPNENPDTYFKDVEMQAVAAKYAKLYNSYNPPRRVDFVEAWILQLIPSSVNQSNDPTLDSLTLRGTICGVEPFIAGEYHKHNNNFGYVSDLERNTPQAFSHFTYEASGQEILVVDIQGVGDQYTDPQIHTKRGKEFGKGNLAVRGFQRFLASHRCNPICRYLKLPLINPKDDESRPVDLQGTIPAQTYMSQPRVVVDQVDSVLCHYYGDSKAFQKYSAKNRHKKKKNNEESHGRLRTYSISQEIPVSRGCGSGESVVELQDAKDRFVAALADQRRSCSMFVCDGISQCNVS
ncbi:hypothetical protein CCR75_007284 [Bremia lactucae]|uniref:Alpha-type protein kinase domain-containing protein n=1 Tax=Bremia lactucae TaxID=4779 RepID=A0A976IGD4_BRELC|nr:hypothetical protein CCR75_007284 [Bremia lactucae]